MSPGRTFKININFEIDTGSACMALSGSLNSVIKPELRQTFFREYRQWFCRLYCSTHHSAFVDSQVEGRDWTPSECCRAQLSYDRRTPGLFKEEFVGDGIIALNSKTYYCWSASDTKFSTKGISNKLNKPTKEALLKVLETKESLCGTNRGFIKRDNSIFTYCQLRTGLTYFYAKRMVGEDGVTTYPIDL